MSRREAALSGLRVVHSIYDLEEALVAKAALDAAGFFCVMSPAAHLSVEPRLRHALGGYRLYVVEPEAEAAQEHLAQLAAAHGKDVVIGAEAACPQCGGVDFRRKRSRAWGLSGLIMNTPLVPPTDQSVCLACGHVVTAERAATFHSGVLVLICALMMAACAIFLRFG